jgi:hypothetical protein
VASGRGFNASFKYTENGAPGNFKSDFEMDDDFKWCRGCGIEPHKLRRAYERLKEEYE